METKTTKHLSIFALITGLVLLIPLVAMQYTEEVNWTGSDFVFMGILLFGSGLVYELITRNMDSRQNKVLVGIIVSAIMLFVWVGGATGFGAE